MNTFQITIWILIGVCVAMIYFATQYWSVRMIDPENYKFSQLLIIGGAVLRWALVCLTLGLALSYSFLAMFLVFFAFWISRMILVNVISTNWQNKLSRM
jgi:hypothetical protein